MKVVETAIPSVLILEPQVHGDARGFFFESYNMRVLREIADIEAVFVQDNHSRSAQNVLRGLHYQIKKPQDKLVRTIAGRVLDVAVDIRRSSPHFGKWVSVELSAENKRIVWIPKGFAHGFVVLSEYAEIAYKTTDYWAPEQERTIAWNDPDLAIAWRIEAPPVLSAKDRTGLRLREAEVFE